MHGTPEVGNALLVDGHLAAELADSPANIELNSQVEVFGKRLRSRIRSESIRCGGPDKLAVSSRSNALEVASPPLENLSEDDELHALHPRWERMPAVVDLRAHLDHAHFRAGGGNSGSGDGIRIEPPVGVGHADDDAIRRAHDVAPVHGAEDGVKGLALAQASVG